MLLGLYKRWALSIDFKCHGCGACCMVLEDILNSPTEQVMEEYQKSIAEFPYKAKDNGHCEKLGEDMKCSVYENRPSLCRIDDHFNSGKCSQNKEDFYGDTTKACKALMKSELKMSDKEIEAVYASLS